MKKILYMPLLSAILYVPGLTDTEHKQILIAEEFSRICIQGDMKVVLVQRFNDNTVQYKDGKISAEVHDGELVVKKKNGLLSSHQPFVIIPVKQLKAVKIADDASVFTQGKLQATQLQIDHRGDGMIKLSVDADYISVYSRGKGKIQIDGSYKQTLARQDETGCMIIEYKNKEN